MPNHQIFCKIDIESWVAGTMEQAQRGVEWKKAWQQTYLNLGGKSDATMTKGCPMKAAETLYHLGRIKNGCKKSKNLPLQKILSTYSKNGVYAVLALDELKLNPNIKAPALWEKIKDRVRTEVSVKPAETNQGGLTVAFKLWHLDLIV